MVINSHLHLKYICLTYNGQVSRVKINFQKAEANIKDVILVLNF